MAKKKPAANTQHKDEELQEVEKFDFEAVAADAYAGPDNCYSQVHCNRNAVFYRINGGDWHRANDMHQSLSKASRVVAKCETISEVHSRIGCH